MLYEEGYLMFIITYVDKFGSSNFQGKIIEIPVASALLMNLTKILNKCINVARFEFNQEKYVYEILFLNESKTL